MHQLMQKIKNRKACIGVIGLGYVGLPLVKSFARAGFPVTGFDIDESKIKKLKAGVSYIKHIEISELKKLNFKPTSDFSLLKRMDAVIICVPTPLTKHKIPDLEPVIATSRTISGHIQKKQLIILESTTYPGTTVEVVIPILNQNKNGLKAGADFFVAFSPEREDPGNKNFYLGTIPKVVGGIDRGSLELACALYNFVVKRTVPVSSTQIAEAAKILENIYRAVNIALVNELKVLFDKMNIDIWEVIEASATKPFGFHPFFPGPGLGGHCIPIDPFYLTWKAKEYGLSTRFIELAGEINTSMPHYVCNKTLEAVNEAGKSIKGAKILILGVSYKKNIDDIRESPSLEIIEILEHMGAVVKYYDPYIEEIRSGRRPNIRSRSLKEDKIKKERFDAALILTDHEVFDYGKILANIPIAVDTRNALKGLKLGKTKVIKA